MKNCKVGWSDVVYVFYVLLGVGIAGVAMALILKWVF